MLRLTTALASHPERTSADAILFLLLTGARRSEALTATWDQFDLEHGVWVKPSAHTKQRKTHRVPLSSPALALLRQRAAATNSPIRLSRRRSRAPADRREAHLGVPSASRPGWQRGAEGRPERATVRDKDGKVIEVLKPTVRLHDLRHTYASILASRGLSLPIIGALLGHTQPQTTARYAHLLDDPLRAATESAADVIANGLADSGITEDDANRSVPYGPPKYTSDLSENDKASWPLMA